jgi:hypothetical protein
MQIDDMDALSSALALQAIQAIGEPILRHAKVRRHLLCFYPGFGHMIVGQNR